MWPFSKKKQGSNNDFVYNSSKSKKMKTWKKVLLILGGLLVLVFGAMAWKTGSVWHKVGSGGVFENLYKALPIGEDKLEGEADGRVNILLLGMRGEGVEGGGLLADTIMIASVKPGSEGVESKASLFSIPRDFYVKVPGKDYQAKINAVYASGEEREKGGGLTDMSTIISEIVGVPIHYAVSINFAGFQQLVDSLGGVDIHLDQPFSETLQFKGLEQRCDATTVFNVPSGNYEEKWIQRKNGTYYTNPKRYPLCYANNADKASLECGGDFELPAGDITLTGEQALCYVRSRVTSSDFDRARRQQEILQKIKTKALSVGVLSDFGTINKMMDSLGNNVRTNMQMWEMKRFFELYQQMGDVKISQKVLENSEEGLLYTPTGDEWKSAGYILFPRGDNYDRIKEAFGKMLN
ncbi:MAG: LCP family protein [Candidatus Moranbacteria bacterium]|jgi:LCP family protein required for cell wall assembly|nr:LCP family protein [Candidatus Moranbacteria bacterium]